MIGLRAYLDSSGKLENDYMTLAAVAAPDKTWENFDTEWDKILRNHTPPAAYIHMRELSYQTEGFDRKLGWNDSNAFGLASQCVGFMSSQDKLRFRMFYCTIDLRAYRKLTAESYQLPRPVDICNDSCSTGILAWYMNLYPDLIEPQKDTLRYFFDVNEPFKSPFEKKWRKETTEARKRGGWSIYQRIDEVATVDMRTVPGIQAADIIAWAVNREHTTQPGAKAKFMAHILRHVVPSLHVSWDEKKMRENFKPLIHRP